MKSTVAPHHGTWIIEANVLAAILSDVTSGVTPLSAPHQVEDLSLKASLHHPIVHLLMSPASAFHEVYCQKQPLTHVCAARKSFNELVPS